MSELGPLEQLWRRLGIAAIPINLAVTIVDVLWLLMATAEKMHKFQLGFAGFCAVVGLVAAIDIVRKPRSGLWPLVAMGAGLFLGMSQSYYIIGMLGF